MRTKFEVLGMLMLSVLLLGACDSASPTPVVPTQVKATATPIPPTITPVLIVPTLIVPSPSPVATATPIFVATATPVLTQPTLPLQTTAATPAGAVTPVPPTLIPQPSGPSLLNAQEIQVDPAISAEVIKQMSGGNKPAIKFYVSDESVATLKSAANGIFTGAGYLAVSPFTEEEPVVAFFAKPNAPDLVFSAATIPANPPDLLKTMFNISDPSSEMSQSFAAQLKGKKSLVVLISATGLLPSAPGSTPRQP